MADFDGELAGNAEAGIDVVISTIGAADDAGRVEHGEVLGNSAGSGTEAVGDLAHRKRLALGELTEDAPAALARDGGKDFREGWLRAGGDWR